MGFPDSVAGWAFLVCAAFAFAPRLAGMPEAAAWLEDPDFRVRIKAVRALGELEPSPEAALSLLREAAGDRHPSVREEAIDALLRVRIGPEDALSVLSELIGDPYASIRKKVIAAVNRLPPGSPKALEILRAAAGDRDPAVCESAMEAVAKSRLKAEKRASVLARAVSSPFVEVRLKAVRALASLDHGSAAAPLIQALTDPGERVSTSIMTTSKPNSQEGEEKTTKSHEWVSLEAVEALKKLGPKARDARPALRGLLADRRVLLLARVTTRRYSGGKVAVEETLIVKPLRLFAVQALESIGVEAAQDIALLRGMLTDDEEEVRNAVRALLRRVAPGE